MTCTFKPGRKAVAFCSTALALSLALLPMTGAQALEVVDGPVAPSVAPTASVPWELPPSQQQFVHVQPAEVTFSTTAWVDRQDNTYAIGETLSLWVQTTRDAYVTVVSVPAVGNPVIIYPNAHTGTVQITANTPTRIPGPNAAYRLRVGGPAGTDLIKIFASEQPIDLSTAMSTEAAGPFRAITVEPADAATIVQSTFDGTGPGGSWTTYDKVIQVVERREIAAVPAPVSEPASLQIRTDRQAYRVGEAVTMRVASTDDCHLSVVSVSANGQQAVQLFPNAYQPSSFVAAGGTVMLPSQISGVQFIAQGPAGIETLIARCHDAPVAYSYRDGDPAFPQIDDPAAVQRALAIVPVASQVPVRHATTSYIVVQ